MPDLTDDDLAELRRLHDAATPGPWELEASIVSGEYHDPPERWAHLSWAAYPKGADPEHEWCLAGADDNDPNQAQANAELLVAMRNALPGLLAEVERLRAAAPASEDDRWVDLLTRADERANPDEERMYADEDADLIQELAAALRVGSPPPTPAPSVTEAALSVAGYRTDEPAPPLATVETEPCGVDGSWLDLPGRVVPLPPGTAVEVREKQT